MPEHDGVLEGMSVQLPRELADKSSIVGRETCRQALFVKYFTSLRFNPDKRRDVSSRPPPSVKRSCTPMDWRHLSACLDEDPELFFPIGNTGPAILQIEEAKAVCRRCEVREQCLAWALEAGQDHGVWGGMSEDERRALKRRNARAKIRA